MIPNSNFLPKLGSGLGATFYGLVRIAKPIFSLKSIDPDPNPNFILKGK